jgi:hypothetical protein
LLEQHLPGFTESNWTSCLKRHAGPGFPECDEGRSDFHYTGDMNALKTLFRLDSKQEWDEAYIEVKATTRSQRFSFNLSDAQFKLVRFQSTSPLISQAQEWHGTETLYLIINVHSSLSKPGISGVLDDPIRFLKSQQIRFKTLEGVKVVWGKGIAH